MEDIINIAQYIYIWICDSLLGAIPENNWYSANLDVIRGIFTVVLCAVVVLFALALVVVIARFLGSLVDLRR